MIRLPIFGLSLFLICLSSPMCPGQMDRKITTLGEGSTAYVEYEIAGGKVSGTAFCADEPGLFITNSHVVQEVKEGGKVKLVLRTGEEDQQVISAKVYRSDPIVDLALLTTEVRERLTPLPLGRDEDLFLTMQAAVFGYPLGADLALQKGGFPSISVNLPRVSSLRKDKGKLEIVQFDGQLNPGNSGGPVLDANGKVIGVATITVVGGGLNFAIPVGKLTRFLAAPGIEFRPAALTWKNCSDPTVWKFRVIPSKPSAKLPEGLSLSVKVTVDDKSPRTVMADPDGKDRFKLSITPVPESMVSNALEMKVEVIVEIKQGSNVLSTERRATTIIRPGRIVNTPRGRVLITERADPLTDKGLLTVDGKLDSDGIPRGAGRSIRPPQVTIGPVVLTPSPDPPPLAGPILAQDLEMRGHSSEACTVDSSPDGRKLLSGSEDGTIRLWDIESGKVEKVMTGPTGRVHQVIFSPDGKKALSGGADRLLRLWDLSTGQVLRVFRGHADWVLAFAFTPDGKKIVSAGGANGIWTDGRDFAVRVWDADTAKLLATWPGHTAMVFALRVSPDGKLALSASQDGTARLWDITSGKLVRKFPGQHTVGLDAIFTPDGKRVVLSGDGNVVRIYEVADAREVSVLRGHGSHVGSLSISKDGSLLASGSWGDRTVRIWRLPEGKELTQAVLASNPPYGVLTPDGRRLLCACSDGSIHRFPLPEQPAAEVKVAGSARPIPLAVKVDGHIADVIVGGGGRYLILHLKDQRALAIFDVNLARIVKTIPLTEDHVLVAAGATTMILAFPVSRTLERVDLTTFAQTGDRVPWPIKGTLKSLLTGSDSDGPLLVIWDTEPSQFAVGNNSFSFLDPRTLKVLKVDPSPGDGQSGVGKLSPSAGTFWFHLTAQGPIQARASSGGGLFAFWNPTTSPTGFRTLAIEGGSLRARSHPESTGEVVPGPDNWLIFNGWGSRLDPDGRQVGPPIDYKKYRRMAIPSIDPAYYLMVSGLSSDLGMNQTQSPAAIRVSVHSSNDGNRLLTIRDLDEMDGMSATNNVVRGVISVDKRFHHIPAANLLITIPSTNDRLVLRRLDVEKVLKETSDDTLVITSPPTLFAGSGKPFRHQIEALSSKGKPKFERSSGPAGLTVSPTGEINWPSPVWLGTDPAIAQIKVTNPAGLERSYDVRFRVK